MKNFRYSGSTGETRCSPITLSKVGGFGLSVNHTASVASFASTRKTPREGVMVCGVGPVKQ